jgi:hypothetical protein
MLNFKALTLILLVSACSQDEHSADINSGKQSATAVKSQTQNLQLKSLSKHSLSDDSNLKSDADAPNLRSAHTLYLAKISDAQVQDSGKVVKILADDNRGSRHQKFLVRISSGQTLLFAHNIDLAPRVADIQVGDDISFRGEYVYNPKGGIVHWTHRDPQGSHYGGWIKHNGNTYQ